MVLSKSQERVLKATLALVDGGGADGYIPEGLGEWATVRALVRRGLMEFAGTGGCIDDSRRRRSSETGDDFQIYALTGAGRLAAQLLQVRP